jgi:hypothetical protein
MLAVPASPPIRPMALMPGIMSFTGPDRRAFVTDVQSLR